MTSFSENLRKRSLELGLTNNEVARRAGLHERTYANYVLGRREPDLKTLVRLAKTLQSSSDELLGFAPTKRASKSELLHQRLSAILETLDDFDLETVLRHAQIVSDRKATRR